MAIHIKRRNSCLAQVLDLVMLIPAIIGIYLMCEVSVPAGIALLVLSFIIEKIADYIG